MATQWQTFPIEFKGGLISNLSALQHGTNAIGSATILQNLEPTKEGGYSKIRGYEKWDSNIVPGSGPVLGVKVVNNNEALAVRSNGTNSVVYHSSGIGWTSKLSMASNGGRVRFVELNFGAGHKIIMVDGFNYPAVFDDSSNTVTPITTSTDVQGAEYVAVYKTTLFYAKDTNLYFTAPAAYDDFSIATGGGVINVGHQITGLAVFRDQLIVFTRNTISRLTGSTVGDFLLVPITDRIGCISGDSIQEVGGDIMYAAPDGIRLLSATDRIGDFGLNIASDPIAKNAAAFIKSSSDFCSLVLREKAQYRIFAYVQSEQHSVASGLLATKFISQGAEGMAWATTKGIKEYCADSKYTEAYDETTIFANEDGYVYELDTGSSFEGNIIEAIYESPYMPITDPQTRKTFYKMTLYAEPTGPMNLDVNFKYDFDTSTNTGVIQPSTFNVSSTGASIFFFGGTSSVFAQTTDFTATASQTDFVTQDVPYTVGADKNKVTVTVNGTETTGFTVASVADGSNYDITVTLNTAANEGDEVFVVLIPPSVTLATTFGGELDRVYNTNVIGSGKTVAIRIEDSSTNPTFTLDTAILEFRQNDRQ